MNNEPSYIIINLDGARINIRFRFGASLLTLVPKMTGSWRLAVCTLPIVNDVASSIPVNLMDMVNNSLPAQSAV